MEACDEEKTVDEVLEFITVVVILAVFAISLLCKRANQHKQEEADEIAATNETVRVSEIR